MSKDTYLCQFREDGQEDFKTDCAFLPGQLSRSIDYVKTVVAVRNRGLTGQVFDVDLKKPIYRFSLSDGDEYLFLTEA